MTHKVTITTKEEKTVEEYWILHGVYALDKHLLQMSGRTEPKEYSREPTIEEIAQFLSDSHADFVTVNHNYRFASELPF